MNFKKKKAPLADLLKKIKYHHHQEVYYRSYTTVIIFTSRNNMGVYERRKISLQNQRFRDLCDTECNLGTSQFRQKYAIYL